MTSSGNKAVAVKKKPVTHYTDSEHCSAKNIKSDIVCLVLLCTFVFEQPMTAKLAGKIVAGESE